ncbi:hypothetical protein LTR65_004273 [Meristemomyces frigidus]
MRLINTRTRQFKDFFKPPKLQELLAPRHLTFCTVDWKPWFTLEKAEPEPNTSQQWARRIETITAIPLIALRDRSSYDMSSFCVAQKMGWAARRVATRGEDNAYSLLGLFNVNMPLLYGEGHRAFQRLQQAIINESDDESVFAWKRDDPGTRLATLLAPDPTYFTGCGRINLWGTDDWLTDPTNLRKPRQPYAITDKGLSIRGRCFTFAPHHSKVGLRIDPPRNQLRYLILNCFESDPGDWSKPTKTNDQTNALRQCVLRLCPKPDVDDTFDVVDALTYTAKGVRSLSGEDWDGVERQLYVRMVSDHFAYFPKLAR